VFGHHRRIIMADFNKAIEITLGHEGGYVNHPNDPGGATQYGISLRFLKSESPLLGDVDNDGDVDADDIKKMTRAQATEIYRKHFWDKYGYSQFSSQDVANKVFDMCVNMGSRQAHKLLQRACCANLQHCNDDGLIGPKTLAASNCCNSEALLTSLRSEQAGFYRTLAAAKPKFNAFKKGWLRRAYS
jgi:lysozyme family protein